jgi:pyruvate,water dikinase
LNSSISNHILWLHELRLSDLAQVGGKNSSLGEMIGNLSKLGVSVPGGFATTADAFREFIAHNDCPRASSTSSPRSMSRTWMRW